MNLNLKEKVIVVADNGDGIGTTIAESLALENAIAVIVGGSESENQLVIEKIMAVGGMAYSIEAELTNATDCEKAIKIITERYGRIDGLVNSAKMKEGVVLENGNHQTLDASIVEYASPFLEKTKGPIVTITISIDETGQTTNQAIADMATFLMSSRSKYTTKQIIDMDGGYVHLDRAILK